MKRILAFSFFPAFTPPRNGGEVRLLHLYRELSRFHHVTLLSSSHVNVPVEQVCHNEHFVEWRIPKDDHFLRRWGELAPIACSGDLSALAIAASAKDPTPLHQAYLDHYAAADVIVHDFPFTLDYDIFFGLDAKPRVYNSQNCETDLYAMLHPDAKSAPLREMVASLEPRLLAGADLVGYCASTDLQAFGRQLGREPKRAVFLPNGVNPKLVGNSTADAEARPIAIFIGSGHLPNVEAALHIANVIAAAMPQMDFHVLGSCLPEGSYARNVFRHGPVTDGVKKDLFQRASFALNTTTSGSGSNLKLLDFLASALPVVSTPFGVRGTELVDGEHCIVADLDRFADVLRAWLPRLAQARAIGRNGRAFVEKTYSWAGIAERWAAEIDRLDHKTGAFLDTPHLLEVNDFDPFAGQGGGNTRIRGVLDAITAEFPVVYLSFSGDGTIGARRIGERLVHVTVPKTPDHEAAEQDYNRQFHISVADIICLEHVPRNALLNAAYRVLSRGSSLVLIDHTYMVGLPARHGDRFVYLSQNHETLLKTSLLQWHPDRDRLLALLAPAEAMATDLACLVVTVSDSDAEAFVRGRASVAPTLTVRNGAGRVLLATDDESATVAPMMGAQPVVFLGSAHMPNAESAQFVVQKLAPAAPDITFHIVGSVCHTLGDDLPPNVRKWGVVSDERKAAILSQCRLALNPMWSGGGSNVKLADYIGNGLFVLCTPFGVRGYPKAALAHVDVVELDAFPSRLRELVAQTELCAAPLQAARRDLFDRELTMAGNARRLVNWLQAQAQPQRRVLFVTYRYTHPPLGGAEVMMDELITALARSGRHSVDVVATDVQSIGEHGRFAGDYWSDEHIGARTGVAALRYRRFPVDTPAPGSDLAALRETWRVQPAFERRAFEATGRPARHGLAWGWGYPETQGGYTSRWAFQSAGLYLAHDATVELECLAHNSGGIFVTDGAGTLIDSIELQPHFTMRIEAARGALAFSTSTRVLDGPDPRPLAFRVSKLLIDGQPFDMGAAPLWQDHGLDAEAAYAALHEASRQTRDERGLRLTDLRGPFSRELDAFLQAHVADYDLVVTHNPVFRPAVVAARIAAQVGRPLLLVPHAHLDDDFYHFADQYEAVALATRTLAAPKSTVDFYRSIGFDRVGYLPAGIDGNETFSAADVQAFDAVFGDPSPFVLVLGRKAQAKGYATVIAAAGTLAPRQALKVVLIGPDDDGVPVQGPRAVYLGRQPREVVRGALMRCVALVNMSESESFGIVLLEAWRAGRPVVVNSRCSAFRDLATDDVNALLVTPATLAGALARLLDDEALCRRLAAAGAQTALAYTQEAVNAGFIETCDAMIDASPRDVEA